MRYISIDYGRKRVGIAVSDEGNAFALPKVVLENKDVGGGKSITAVGTNSALYSDIARLVAEYGATEIVIGESKDLKGAPNPIMSDILELKTLLENSLKLPVHLEPEFFTSAEAERIQGKTESHDASAAALILKSFLDKKAHQAKVNPPAKTVISFDDFAKVEMKLGRILHAERVPATDKLLRLEVDFGEVGRGDQLSPDTTTSIPRQVVSGISAYFPEPKELVGKTHLFVTNLEPRKIKGLESQAMIVAVGDGETFSLLSAKEGTPPGSSAR